jgi:CBS domain containing-hemolysin-like protein
MNTIDLLWIIPVMLVMLLLKGFFSGSEIALVSADKLKLSHRAKQGNKGARLVVQLFKRPEWLLTTTLIGTNISTVVFTTLGTLTMIHFCGGEQGDLYAFLLFTPLLLILGEIVPKSIYQQKANEMAPVIIYPLHAIGRLLNPVIFVFSRVARIAARIAGGKANSQHMFVNREQLRAVLEMADRAQGKAVFDRIRIERAIRFSELTVGSEMIPVAEIVAIDNEKATADAIRLVRRSGYSRLPAYQGDSNNVVGIVTLASWDLLDPEVAKRALEELIQPAHYVSPHDSLEELLPVLRERDDQMAIVVDEYGSTIGMITMDDVMEAVVGDLDTGFDFGGESHKQKRRFEEVSDGVYRLDGRLPIQEANALIGADLPATEFHTIGGMLVARLHHLAKPGESNVASGFRFTVEEATERFITKIRAEHE